jgi:CRISPR-associated protein Cmr1
MTAPLEITLRATTPVFCRGKDGETPELRVPSLKGLLRWWYRAWHPHAVAGPVDSPWIEARVMGGTEKHIGQCPFMLRVEHTREPRPVSWNELRSSFPPARDRISGLNYLGFAFRPTREVRQDQKAIADGTEFSALHHFPHGIGEEAAKGLLAAWWLLGHFGGLGARSRRGFGSLAIMEWKWPSHEEALRSLPLGYRTPNSQAWPAGLIAGLETLRSWRAGADWGHPYPHPHIGVDSRLAIQARNWSRAAAAHDQAGSDLAIWRRDYRERGVLDGRVTFGLPFKGEKPATWRREPFEGSSDIHASPLHLHVAAFNQGRAFGLTWFRLSGAVPGRGEYRLARGGETIQATAPDAIGAFMTHLDGMPETVGRWPR